MADEADDPVGVLKGLLGRSEYIKAFDLARTALADDPGNLPLRHGGVLALARMGATSQAQRIYADWGLDDITDDEDVLALKGRLLKDEALSRHGEERRRGLHAAAAAYRRAFDASGGYFSAINVASLSHLAGENAEAARWAATASRLAAGEESYYGRATMAEAAIVLGDLPAAGLRLREAVAMKGASLDARATTRRQLRMLLSGRDETILKPLEPPGVAHFCGHRLSAEAPDARFPPSREAAVAEEVRGIVAAQDIRFAVGSLASGADIIVAEAVLDAGGDLEVVLPFAQEEFIDVSVRPDGAAWVERFHRCLEGASDVHFVTAGAYLGHDALFGHASHFALGLACLRSAGLDAPLHQIAVWDGLPAAPDAVAGTAPDVAMGRSMGLLQHIVAPNTRAPEPVAAMPPQPACPDRQQRQRRTMVFGDLKGFSKLQDEQIPPYVDHVLGAIARVLDSHEGHLVFRNTWGDGLFLVFDEVTAAAGCAFALQEAMAALDWQDIGLPGGMGLRLGMHYGPVFERTDHVLGRPNVFGEHVSRAARVEPITPEGQVYATDATAAALAVDARDRFRSEYVGRLPLAKGYGEFRMYAVSQVTQRGDLT